jgi:hypothetical protein
MSCESSNMVASDGFVFLMADLDGIFSSLFGKQASAQTAPLLHDGVAPAFASVAQPFLSTFPWPACVVIECAVCETCIKI